MKYRLDVDNKWDSIQDAKSSEEAIKKLFPKAKKISWAGTDDDDGYYFSEYDVIDDKGQHHSVKVYEESNMSMKINKIIEKVLNENPTDDKDHSFDVINALAKKVHGTVNQDSRGVGIRVEVGDEFPRFPIYIKKKGKKYEITIKSIVGWFKGGRTDMVFSVEDLLKVEKDLSHFIESQCTAAHDFFKVQNAGKKECENIVSKLK